MQRKERLQEPNVFFRAKGFSGESGTRGRRCQTLCRIRTYAPLIASISSSPLSSPPPLNPSGKQQSSRPRLVPSSNTRSRSSQLPSRIQRGRGGEEMMQLPSNQKEQKQLCSRPRLVPRQKQDSQLAHCI